MNKKTGEMIDLAEWIKASDTVGAPAPSCKLRRQRGRKEFNKRLNAEQRRQKQIRKAVDKSNASKAARASGQPDSFSLF